MTVVTAQDAEGDEVCTWELTACPQDIEHWRGVAADTVAGLGGDQGAVTLARLVVTELLSNVVKHVADPRCRLVIAAEGNKFRITVRDRSLEAPALRVPDWDSESGRGLWLLREMAPDWGYTCIPGGKDVWVRNLLVSPSEVSA